MTAQQTTPQPQPDELPTTVLMARVRRYREVHGARPARDWPVRARRELQVLRQRGGGA